VTPIRRRRETGRRIGFFYGPAFATKTARHWLARVGVQTLLITPGSPWRNGSIESINERLRDDRLDTPWEVTVVVGR
jgi:transposase InsO family protein